MGLVVILVLWTANAEIFHLGGVQLPKKGETRLALAPTPSDLGIDRWQVGALTLKENQAIYEATIVDAASAELFKLKLDAVTGQPVGENRPPSTGTALPLAEVRRRLVALLPRLTTGEVTRKQNQPFAQVALLYEGRTVARIRVDPATGQPINSAARKPEKGPEEKEVKAVPGNLVTPLGWIAAILAIVVTLYYSWKRSLVTLFRIAEAGKQQVAAALKRTLDYHCYLSLAALGIAALHSWNELAEVRWSLSWLTLGMMATVSVSGFFGKYLARTESIRMTWRRFHVPYTVLFFAVLGIHILQKIKVL